jgi:hypothetical protein
VRREALAGRAPDKDQPVSLSTDPFGPSIEPS